MQLIDYLIEKYPNTSKKEIKNWLKYKRVVVNQNIITQFNFEVSNLDNVEITKSNTNSLKFDILYEDQELVVINKPSGLLSISTEKEKNKTAYHYVSEYLKKKDKRAKVFVVHRLDQDTSGVLIFAKNEKIKYQLQESWNDIVKVRGYMAIVEGCPKQKRKTIKSYLKESSTQKVYSSKKMGDGKLAITHYEVKKSISNYSLLKIELDTGRKNQIRVHMQDLGHPIAGDRKYGAKTNPIKRLCLHSDCVEVIHPLTHQLMRFVAPLPREFQQLMKLKENDLNARI